MQCVVLAAGEGKRMRPLTASRPKVMLPVGNRPMVEHLVIAARNAGIKEFIFVVGYGEREIRKHFTDGSYLGVAIRYVTQRMQMGTADALNTARGLVKGRFLLLNGDMVLKEDDIREIINEKAPCVGIFHSDHPKDYGVVIEERGMITALEEKTEHPKSDMINAGVYLFDTDIFDLVDDVKVSSRGELELTDALAVLIDRKQLHAYPLQYWMDIGYPWDLLAANASMLDELEPDCEGKIEEGVTIHGKVSLGKGSVIKSGTYIEGPCSIGKNCRIGPHAYIRGSTSIGDNCHIGHSTEIKNSIVMADTNVPHFNYLGDSIVGSRCNFGAGTKVANLRHDHATIKVSGKDTRLKKFGVVVGDGVQFGINCSLNVGTVVGANTKIAPHSFIEGNIGEESQVK
jgi:UDP-N-acetylglucosamine diphosphorylase / glucose-1-phosphate thymidylyltransferase / UDP-N-acetylgalactosamine diphosphorylase / glucosamine-1-phosphate N-acetyltransferase / galactosamine-1-phosphate N-acetyltransferase